MSQNPYATPYPQQYGQPQPMGYGTGVPARTSAMAVLSLVCSLVCCIPGLSVLGVLFGGLALLAIAMSGGRVKGVGLAIAGLIVGIVISVVWVMMLVGATQAAGMMNQMVDPALKAIDARDRDAVHTTFVASAHPTLDETRINDFRAFVASEYGTYERMPDGIGELVGEFITIMSDPQVGPATNAAQAKYGQSGVFPMPAKFDTGWQAIMVYMDSTSANSTGMPLLRDLGVVKSDGTIEWLVAGNSSGPTFQMPQIPPLNLPDLNGEGEDEGDGGGELNGDPEPEPEPAPEQPRNRNRPPK